MSLDDWEIGRYLNNTEVKLYHLHNQTLYPAGPPDSPDGKRFMAYCARDSDGWFCTSCDKETPTEMQRAADLCKCKPRPWVSMYWLNERDKGRGHES